MKITFSNLGSIKKTTLDLRPLTVIIGPNNSNKTYIAYSVYGLLQGLRENYFDLADNLKYEPYGDTVYSVSINRDFTKRFSGMIRKSCNEFKETLDTFFQDSTKRIFKKSNFIVDLPINEIRHKIKSTLSPQFALVHDYMFIGLTDTPLKIFYNADDFWEQADEYDDEFQIKLDAMQFFNSMFFPKPFLLPAERNAFIITYKMLANRRYKLLRDAQRGLFSNRVDERQLDLLKEQGDIRYPQPIEDFLDFLTDIEFKTNKIEDSKQNLNYYELADKIEKEIQGTNKTNFKPTKFGGKEIKIKVKKGLDIDLYNASSSIKQLAPLLLYLRYRAKDNDLLIIDEPEMNLHPESQAKLLEVLGMLVNAGIKVLITTHSPYFMSHLNNLVNGKTDDEKVLKEQAKSLYLKDDRAFLKMEDVSAYEMKNNELNNLKDQDYGIRWDTLSDVSADIQQKFFEIYEKGEEPTDGEEK